MEQQLRCKFRGPPSTVSASGLQSQEDRRGPADDGRHLQSRSIVQVEVRVFPHGAPIDRERAFFQLPPLLVSLEWEFPRSSQCYQLRDSCIQGVDLCLAVWAVHLSCLRPCVQAKLTSPGPSMPPRVSSPFPMSGSW